MKRLLQVLALGVVAVPMAGCNRQGEFSPVDMWNRSRIKTYEPVEFFDDRSAYRSKVPGTIARGQKFIADDAIYRGIGPDGRYLTAVPASIITEYASKSERNLIARGQERYQIYCQMCHGIAGHGDGMVVKRGFVPPPDYRIKRLRDAPIGHFYDVIANGYGAMYSYAARVPMQDRWAISAYVRELQRVQPEVVPDVRYQTNSTDGRDRSGRPKPFGSSGTQAAPQNTRNDIGTPGNDDSDSQRRQGAGGVPASQPKNPMQAMPEPGVMATPGLNDGMR